jgi:hypothetical protein
VAYVLAVEERTQMSQLVALGVEKDPRDALDELFGVKAWTLPGQQARPVVVREPGTPDWWEGPEEASNSFLSAMGIRL